MSSDFQGVLDHLRSTAKTEREKGYLFERLMKRYFQEDPIYQERFANVLLWPEWAEDQPGFDRRDTGIDLVAEEREGGVCAIQCKFYAPGTRLSKPHLDSFISDSNREPFTARLLVDTGDEWGPNATKTISGISPACQVLSFADLENQSIDWPDLIHDEPESLSVQREAFELQPHQKKAFDDVIKGFAKHDRGKMIMACGTGKTFTALRIAEHVAGVGGRALYLVPSISLLQQSMREWATQGEVPHRYIGICSDVRAGRDDEDATLEELEIPVTTDPSAISKALRKSQPDVMTVAFCTYHSLPIVENAQIEGGGGTGIQYRTLRRSS